MLIQSIKRPEDKDTLQCVILRLVVLIQRRSSSNCHPFDQFPPLNPRWQLSLPQSHVKCQLALAANAQTALETDGINVSRDYGTLIVLFDLCWEYNMDGIVA